MKKLIAVFAMFVAMTFAACGNSQKAADDAVDSTAVDSVVVDSTVVVDSVAADSVCTE